jgi:hypothetical protein
MPLGGANGSDSETWDEGPLRQSISSTHLEMLESPGPFRALIGG